MITQADGDEDQVARPAPVNVTIKDVDDERRRPTPTAGCRARSPTAFGGAIRDMWNPTCYGDPGKVSDAEYHCGTDDTGGVHSNSGVVNHAFASWSTAAPSTAPASTGSASTKALAIYWRAMTTYLTPTSDFADHADAPRGRRAPT